MIGGKGMSVHKPTALGTLIQAATHGLTTPTIYGTTQSALIAIWAANLRKGHCRGKKGKGKKKKGPPQYIENIDMLIGSNPIEGVLQVWENADKWPLNFIKHDATWTLNQNTFVIGDPYFYFLIAVTVDVLNAGNFNDYGSPYLGMISTVALRDPGSGYAVNDTFTVDSGAVLASGHVTSVSGGGVVTGIAFDSFGSGYAVGSHVPTTATSGTGSGMTVDISAVGPAYSDTSEYPLWNVAQHGPDLIDAGYAKYYPHVYQWVPADGDSIFLPFVQSFMAPSWGIPGGQGTLHFYYAQLSSAIKRQVPLTRSCLTFEPVLGDGSEYSVVPSQQILYPEYAGAGSAHIDLGTSGAIPSVKPEVVGSFKRYAPRGDADFADMIEDTIKSGMLQVGSQLGLIQRGVNCNELPGAVQKSQYWNLEPTPSPAVTFQQPIFARQVLCVFCRWRGNVGTGPTISDDAGNTWTQVINGGNYGFWRAIASADWPARNTVNLTWGGTSGFAYDIRYYGWAMDQGSDTIDATASASGSGTSASCSITVTGAPTFILAVVNSDNGFSTNPPTPPPHWANLFPTMQNNVSGVFYRIVSAPGTYTFRIAMFAGGGATWQLGLLAIKASQPAPYPKALGNILDGASLETVRAMCQAGGLFGSVTMNSQRPAADWLKEFFTCANAAPVWSGFRLKAIARSEVSAVGNGRVYIAPTASGPVATLTESDLVGDSSAPLISVERKAQVDANNILQVQYFDRNADYNPSVASEPLSGAIALFGPRKEAPVILPEIQDPSVARKVLAIEVRRRTLLRNVYKFKAKAKWLGLEAMDLILINESKIGITNLPVRLTKVEETDTFELDMEAEPFIYGCHAPNDLPTTVLSPFTPGSGGDPGSVNAPIIFEPVPRLTSQQNQAQLWLVVSSPSADYGGCAVLISTDGGASYKPIGTIFESAVTGYTVGDWPAANDPDTLNDLHVDLTESLGTLDTFTPEDRDNFIYPCYVSAPTPTPTILGHEAGDYRGIDNTVPGGSPKYCYCDFGDASFLPTDEYFVVCSSRYGSMAIFGPYVGPPTTPVRFWGYVNSEGNYDFALFDPSTSIPPFPFSHRPFFVQPQGSFYYDFAMMIFAVRGGSGRVPQVFPVTGAGSVSEVVNGRTFSYTVSHPGLAILQIDPPTPGNVPLLLAVLRADGTTGADTGHGWSLNYHPPNNEVGGPGGDYDRLSLSSQNGAIPSLSGVAYELMTYDIATLTASYKYTLPATGGGTNELRRGVFGAPGPTVGLGVDHLDASRFAFLDPMGFGIFKANLDPSWTGKTLWFKFLAFNLLGNFLQDQADATAYSYVPTGAGTMGQNPGSTTYSISGGALTQPTGTSIHMDEATADFPSNAATYNARTFSIIDPLAPTTYYVTIYDPAQLGDTGAGTNLSAYCETTPAKRDLPGYIYIGSIVAIPGGGGTTTGIGGSSPGAPGGGQIFINGV